MKISVLIGLVLMVDIKTKKILSELVKSDTAQIIVDDEPLVLYIMDCGSKLLLATKVYEGDGYIPASVRSCTERDLVFGDGRLRTFLKLDEKRCIVSLNYLGLTSHLRSDKLERLVREFVLVAKLWRSLLDEHGRDDFAYIRYN